MIKGTLTGPTLYLCDKCLTPCQKALKPTLIEDQEVWEICESCKEKRRVKSITDRIREGNEDKSI